MKRTIAALAAGVTLGGTGLGIAGNFNSVPPNTPVHFKGTTIGCYSAGGEVFCLDSTRPKGYSVAINHYAVHVFKGSRGVYVKYQG